MNTLLCAFISMMARSQGAQKIIQVRKLEIARRAHINISKIRVGSRWNLPNLLVPVGLTMGEAVLVHDPAAPEALGSLAHIEH
jgi:hypothetical protein